MSSILTSWFYEKEVAMTTWTESSVFEKLQGFVSEQFNRERDAVTREIHFVNDLEADSLDAIELVMQCEGEFDIDISDEDVEKITTLQSAVNFILSTLQP